MFKYKGMSLQNPRLRKQLRRVPLTFTRASVAYDYNGDEVPVDTPRFTHLINGEIVHGCLVEEAHTNLLTANQSTGTDTLGNTTGFGKFSGTDISSDSSTYIQGNKSLKVSLSGATANEGVNTGSIDVAGGKTYTQSVKIKIPKGSVLTIQIVERDSADVLMGVTSKTITGTGDFQDVSVTRAFEATGVKQRVYIISPVAAKFDFNVDMLQLAQTPYPLSWTLGGTTQAAETFTLPGHTLNPISGTIEVEAYIEPHHKGRAWVLLDQNNKMRVIHTGDGFLQFQTNNGVDTTTTPGIPDTDLVDGFNRVTARYNEDEISIMVNGDPDTLSVEADPSLPPTNTNPLTLDNSFNGLIRELTLSNTARPDNDAVARATRPEGHGFGVDRQVTLIAPLKNNLNAYRVATV